jgi:hypothetical protein
MTDKGPDLPVRHHIERLVDEEHKLHARKSLTEPDRQRLDQIKIELDQCWDLLRQRRALREFKQDPDQARVRPADVVEKYEG